MSKLNRLDAWANGTSEFFAAKSAQGHMRPAMAAGACGASCGAGDEKKEEPKPACGASCGAGEEK